MDQADKAKYKQLYLQTGKAYLVQMRTNIEVLLKNKDDQVAREAAHIAAHSLKSQSLLMGYTTTGLFSATVEKIFKTHEENKTDIAENILKVILTGLDKLDASFDQIQRDDQELNIADIVNDLQKSSGVTVELS